MSWVITGTRPGGNQVVTRRSTLMNVITSPAPTRMRPAASSTFQPGEHDLAGRRHRTRDDQAARPEAVEEQPDRHLQAA